MCPTLGPTGTSGVPAARESHTGIFTGSEMIVWGGWDGSQTLGDGKRYNPVTGTWGATTSAVGAPSARQTHGGTWTGSRMVIWGGRTGGPLSTAVDSGAMYDPVTDTWVATSTTGAPSARSRPTAIWTGREVIVWGGASIGGVYLATGGRFHPVTNAWLGPLPTSGAPSARYQHRAVWTGTRMIVWGGDDVIGSTNTGGIYQPAVPGLGAHASSIVVTAAGANNSPLSIPLSLTVTP